MVYATAIELIERVGAEEVARASDRQTPRTIDGNSLAAWLRAGTVGDKTTAAAQTGAIIAGQFASRFSRPQSSSRFKETRNNVSLNL